MYIFVVLLNGGCSSVGRAPDCGSGCRGFESRHSPQKLKSGNTSTVLPLFLFKKITC